MKTRSSLRYQINLRIALTSIIVLIAGGVITVWEARQSVKAELDSSLNLATQLIQHNFTNGAQQGAGAMDNWLPGVISTEQTEHLSIQLKQPDGNTVNFAAEQKKSTETTPPSWFVQLVSAQSSVVEQKLTDAKGKHAKIIIRAEPMAEISEAWKESCAFLATLAFMTGIILLSVNLLFNKTIKPIADIVAVLTVIEQGNYQQKLPTFPTEEYNNIASAINHMVDVMAETSQENKALTLHTLQIQESERQHLAKDLHDELGQSLTAIKVMATAAKTDKADTHQIAGTIISVCDHLIAVVRSMMRNLHPSVLTELGLKAGLEDLLHNWSLRHPGLSVKLDCPEKVDKLEQKNNYPSVQDCAGMFD